MPTYVYRNGKIVRRPRNDRTDIPFVMSDMMQPLRHMATGQIIDSKAKYRAVTKASGCVEIGNELPKSRIPMRLDRWQRREDIKRAIYDLRNGRN